MHGNDAWFWNRDSVYNRLSVDEVSFIDKFEDNLEIVNGFLSDELFYRQAVEKISTYQEPFFTLMLSASSHTPFLLEGLENKEEILSISPGMWEDTQLGNYLEAANYADYAFGIFIDELKQKGLYEDSVILVFGDHYGVTMDEPGLEEFMLQINPDYNEISKKINYANVLCGLKIPGLKNEKIDKPISKLDIKPTLLQFSGIEDSFSLGKTIFSTKDYAYINNGHIITEKYYYCDEEWYDINTGEELDTNKLDKEEGTKLAKYVENMCFELDISSSIIINNLFQGKY